MWPKMTLNFWSFYYLLPPEFWNNIRPPPWSIYMMMETNQRLNACYTQVTHSTHTYVLMHAPYLYKFALEIQPKHGQAPCHTLTSYVHIRHRTNKTSSHALILLQKNIQHGILRQDLSLYPAPPKSNSPREMLVK